MGKGSKPRPVSKHYGENYDRIFGKRCLKHRRKDCPECFPPKLVFPCGLEQCDECEAAGATRQPAK